MTRIVIGYEPSFEQGARVTYVSDAYEAATIRLDEGLSVFPSQPNQDEVSNKGEGHCVSTSHTLSKEEDALVTQLIESTTLSLPPDEWWLDGVDWYVWIERGCNSLHGHWGPWPPQGLIPLCRMLFELAGHTKAIHELDQT